MLQLPSAKYGIGDILFFTNPQGVCWGKRTVIGFEYWELSGWRYFISDIDTPWYPVKESCLTENVPVDVKVIAYKVN